MPVPHQLLALKSRIIQIFEQFGSDISPAAALDEMQKFPTLPNPQTLLDICCQIWESVCAIQGIPQKADKESIAYLIQEIKAFYRR